jgi:hypothetical protein
LQNRNIRATRGAAPYGAAIIFLFSWLQSAGPSGAISVLREFISGYPPEHFAAGIGDPKDL